MVSGQQIELLFLHRQKAEQAKPTQRMQALGSPMKSNKECPKSARSSVAAGKRKLTAVKSEEAGSGRGREEEPRWPGAQCSDTQGELCWGSYGSRPQGASCTTLSCWPPACSHPSLGFISGNSVTGKPCYSLTLLCHLFTLLYPSNELKYFLLTKPCRWCEVNVILDDLYFFTYVTSHPMASVMILQHPKKR